MSRNNNDLPKKIPIKNNLPKEFFETNETNDLKQINFSIDNYIVDLDPSVASHRPLWGDKIFISSALHEMFKRRFIDQVEFEYGQKDDSYKPTKYKFNEKYLDDICVIAVLYQKTLERILKSHTSAKINVEASLFTTLISELKDLTKCIPIDGEKDDVDVTIKVWKGGKMKGKKPVEFNSILPHFFASFQDIIKRWESGTILDENEYIQYAKYTLGSVHADQHRVNIGNRNQSKTRKDFTELTWDLYKLIAVNEMIRGVDDDDSFSFKIIQCIIDIYTLMELPDVSDPFNATSLLSWEPTYHKDTCKDLNSWLNAYDKKSVPIDER